MTWLLLAQIPASPKSPACVLTPDRTQRAPAPRTQQILSPVLAAGAHGRPGALAPPSMGSVVSCHAGPTDPRQNPCGSNSGEKQRSMRGATRWSCFRGSQGARASRAGHICRRGPQPRGGLEGRQMRPTCVLTQACRPSLVEDALLVWRPDQTQRVASIFPKLPGGALLPATVSL